MRILICPDSFKGTLSALEVATIIGKEFAKKNHQVELAPIADGGEGTVDTLLFELGGKKKYKDVHDPLGRRIRAYYGLNGKEAYIEMAQSSGLHRLKLHERNPWLATTFGFGELIQEALNRNVKKIILGIGGSATNDVGIGMAQALGIRVLDKKGKEIAKRKKEGYGACCLNAIETIDLSHRDKRINKVDIEVLSDVQNPLYGKHGASQTYAGQKGASAKRIKILEQSVKRFARIMKRHLGIDPNFPGAGAAGGLGAGLKLFLNASIVSGIDGLIRILNLEQKIKKADLVVVGEGQMDWQTAYGKAPAGIAKLAKKHKKPVIAINGKIGRAAKKNFKTGIHHIFACYGKQPITTHLTKEHCRRNLHKIAAIAVKKIPNLKQFRNQITIGMTNNVQATS